MFSLVMAQESVARTTGIYCQVDDGGTGSPQGE